MTLQTSIHRLTLPLERPFTIARGTTTSCDIHVVEISDSDGNTGIGTSAPRRYYGETAETVGAVLPEYCAYLESDVQTLSPATIERELTGIVDDNPAARTTVSVALADLFAKRNGRPLYEALGHAGTVSIASSYTLGIDEPAEMAEHAASAIAAGHGTLKVKLGGAADAEAIEAVRAAAPTATLRVDANAAWTPNEALTLIDICAEHDVEFVEQPVPATDHTGLKTVYERSALPIAADESCVTLHDVPRVADRADIINIKLMKCGGVWEALRMIHTGRAHDLEVMLGCMVESAPSIAAAAHLTPLVDYADLDGALLLAEDEYTGSPVTPGDITLASERPGLGVTKP